MVSCKSVHLGVSKMILQFSHYFNKRYTTLSSGYFYPVIFIYSFFLYRLHLILFFVRKKLTIDQWNVQAPMAKNEEQYTLSNIIHFEFQNCYFFLWGVLWRRFSLDVDNYLIKVFQNFHSLRPYIYKSGH